MKNLEDKIEEFIEEVNVKLKKGNLWVFMDIIIGGC